MYGELLVFEGEQVLLLRTLLVLFSTNGYPERFTFTTFQHGDTEAGVYTSYTTYSGLNYPRSNTTRGGVEISERSRDWWGKKKGKAKSILLAVLFPLIKPS